ncbi:MAG: hypothetical protein DBX44_00155 [Oscillospiraceae bacterium]|nr:MAG: hypothetical protein DBX44_00155 [Oscillospiraceae bacterium]
MGLKENLRQQRRIHGLTLEEAGQAIGVSRQTILRYETGAIANPPAAKIEGLAALYHTTPARLMGWEQPAQVQAAFYGGASRDPQRQKDLDLLATLGQADDQEGLLTLWDGMNTAQRRSLLQYARFLLCEGGSRLDE